MSGCVQSEVSAKLCMQPLGKEPLERSLGEPKQHWAESHLEPGFRSLSLSGLKRALGWLALGYVNIEQM